MYRCLTPGVKEPEGYIRKSRILHSGYPLFSLLSRVIYLILIVRNMRILRKKHICLLFYSCHMLVSSIVLKCSIYSEVLELVTWHTVGDITDLHLTTFRYLVFSESQYVVKHWSFMSPNPWNPRATVVVTYTNISINTIGSLETFSKGAGSIRIPPSPRALPQTLICIVRFCLVVLLTYHTQEQQVDVLEFSSSPHRLNHCHLHLLKHNRHAYHWYRLETVD